MLWCTLANVMLLLSIAFTVRVQQLKSASCRGICTSMNIPCLITCIMQYVFIRRCTVLTNTTEMYGDGPATGPREFKDEAGPPLVVYMVRPTPGKV